MRVSTNVAGAAGSGSDAVERLFHRRDDGGMLAHAKVIVRAPDLDRLGAVAAEALGVRIATLRAKDVDEHAVPAFFVKAFDRGLEDLLVIQGPASRSTGI